MFEKKYHYQAVSPVVERFRNQGYVMDFDFVGDCLIANNEKLALEDVLITDLYCLENGQDLSDASIVYAILSKTGLKGIYVTGLGMLSDVFKAKEPDLFV